MFLLLYGTFLALLVASNTLIAERFWPSMLLAYLPQTIWLVPLAIFALVQIVKGRWRRLLAAITIGVAFAFFSGLRVSGGTNSGEVKVMTFNVQVLTLGIDRVTDAIRAENPDVFCLQECDSTAERNVVGELRRALPDYTIVYRGGMATGSRLQMTGCEAHDFGLGIEHRPIIDTTYLLHNGRRLRVLNVHLVPVHADTLLLTDWTAIPGHLSDIADQHERQITMLLEQVRRSNLPTVIGGDFNSPANGLYYRRLSTSMRDSFEKAGSGFGFTMPASLPLMRIDFLYSSGDVRATTAYVPAVVASDHRPTVAGFRFVSRATSQEP